MFNKIDPKECFQKRHSITYQDKVKYCKEKALYQLGYEINLDEPKTLNEKIIWLALNYKDPRIKEYSDKILVKDYLGQYAVPLLQTDEINVDLLPDKFVVKSNSGWAAKAVKICDKKEELPDFSDWLNPWNNYYYNNMCVGCEDIKPRLLVEEYLGDNITDYKLFVMNGKARFFYVVDDRLKEKETKTFLDLDFNVLPCHRWDVPAAKEVAKPPCIDKMIRLGEKLAKDFPLVRVDFYYINGRLYVGELTFTPGMFLSIEPKEWDIKLGQLLDV
ncbi:MAG: hypothetical protein MJ146_05415, partial [Clostridia bacterium]|nr:hypothetical protein [Clostridia bacterium]